MVSKLVLTLLVSCLSLSQCYGYYTTGDCIDTPVIKDFSAKQVRDLSIY